LTLEINPWCAEFSVQAEEEEEVLGTVTGLLLATFTAVMSETSKFADKIAVVRAPPIKVALTLLGRTTTEGRVGLKAEPHLKAMHSILEI
jgi:hypothetical protein